MVRNLNGKIHGDREIVAARPPKQPVDPWRPYHFLCEPEFGADGRVAQVATIFLTNRECPFRCLMCDLWRNTLDQRVPTGAIPAQIDYALARLPAARHVKLYNSGNFFDHLAIPPEDYPAIADRVRAFETVIVENHPRLCGDDCLRFRDLLPGTLEVALGLETVHEPLLARLNKRMTLDDFRSAARFLLGAGIRVRAFILLRPPYLTESEGLEWALKSIAFAQDCGVDCCSVIPTRGGNGLLERLADAGEFAPPKLTTLETLLETALRWGRRRVLVDLWEAERFATCDACRAARLARLAEMNLSQTISAPIRCACQRGPAVGGT